MSTSVAVAQAGFGTAFLDRAVLFLYLASLALLPWAWFPPFPWLHEHAQWSDPVFASAAGLWTIARLRDCRWRLGRDLLFCGPGSPRAERGSGPPESAPAPKIPGISYLAIGLYLIAAILSFQFSRKGTITGASKVLGIVELCMLVVITSDLACQPGVIAKIARVVAVSCLLIAAAAIGGLFLFYAGVASPLIGIYGELTPSHSYARVQAVFYNPNLLASFCIFAAAFVGHRDSQLPAWLRRLAMTALWIAVGLTFSRGIIGFGLAALIRHARTRRRRILAAACAAAGISVMVLLTFCKLSLDPARPFETHLSGPATSSRYQALTTSLESIVKNPFFGAGPDSHPARYGGNPFDSHMTYAGIAATLGLPALAFLSLIICIAWLGRRRPTELSLWGAMAGLAIDGLGQDIESFRHLWVLIGLVLADAASSRQGSGLSGRGLGAGGRRSEVSGQGQVSGLSGRGSVAVRRRRSAFFKGICYAELSPPRSNVLTGPRPSGELD